MMVNRGTFYSASSDRIKNFLIKVPEKKIDPALKLGHFLRVKLPPAIFFHFNVED